MPFWSALKDAASSGSGMRPSAGKSNSCTGTETDSRPPPLYPRRRQTDLGEKTMDDPDFTGTGRRQFRARLEPVKGIRIQHVPGSGTPASLLLALRDRPDLMEP